MINQEIINRDDESFWLKTACYRFSKLKEELELIWW